MTTSSESDSSGHLRGARAVLERCRLQLLLDPRTLPGRWEQVVAAAVDGGVDVVQLRMKEATTEERVAAARSLARQVDGLGVALLINDDVEAAAQLAGAGVGTGVGTGVDAVAGVHLGQHDTPVADARARLGPAAWIGLSTHSRAELEAGHATAATHFGLGACFATTTKRDHRVLARAELAAAVAFSRRPLFAIGGITPENVGELAAVGITRVAVSHALLTARDPRAAAAALRAALARIPPSA